MTQPKERPILFSAPMVRAILAGEKTVTRRALSATAIRDIGYGARLGECYDLPASGPIDENSMSYIVDFCPYGRRGERLWVRETFNTSSECRPPIDEPFIYAADLNSDGVQKWAARWKPSIHMPRVASRILLEITSVRVERLQVISEGQAMAEGISEVAFRPDDGYPICNGYMVGPEDGKTKLETTAAKAFAGLWSSINGAESWDTNPWVWVVEFKRVMPCPS